ncbi:MAG TPA: hypothetical protein VEX38_09335 [Fimbriimonadaceae bacterium]|nr:hypothetical protein [Fimbriimonadaceae bacterium]
MDVKELVSFGIDDVGRQLRQVLSGISPELQDARVCDKGMSPCEMVEHLCEAYKAVVAESQGLKHEWGSFKPEYSSWDGLMAAWADLRSQAREAALANLEAHPTAAHSYIVAHDAYHVGQLALLRVQQDPDWNPYSIYQE